MTGEELTGIVVGWIPILLVCATALACYLAILSYVHVRSRYLYEYYLEVGKQVKKLQEEKEKGGEADALPSMEKMEKLLETLLREERILPRSPAKS